MAQANRLGPKFGDHPGLVLHSSNEPGELSQWLCDDDGIVNIVMTVAITVTIGCG